MDFGLSDEQAALKDAARQFVDRHCPPRQAKEWDETYTYPDQLMKAMAEIGWYGLAFPSEAGGDGGGPVELAIIAEQLGRASLDIAMCFIGTLIPALTIYQWGTDAQREVIASKMFTGETRYAVAMSEPDTGSDAAALRCAAVDMGDHFVVNGEKMWCTGAGVPRHHGHDLCPDLQGRTQARRNLLAAASTPTAPASSCARRPPWPGTFSGPTKFS